MGGRSCGESSPTMLDILHACLIDNLRFAKNNLGARLFLVSMSPQGSAHAPKVPKVLISIWKLLAMLDFDRCFLPTKQRFALNTPSFVVENSKICRRCLGPANHHHEVDVNSRDAESRELGLVRPTLSNHEICDVRYL